MNIKKGENKFHKTHGMRNTKFCRTWYEIRGRCNNPNKERWNRYGGRGIKVLWATFEEFKNDMYESFLVHNNKFGGRQTSIERIDNDGHYCKENCRWATVKEQSLNRRKRQNYHLSAVVLFIFN